MSSDLLVSGTEPSPRFRRIWLALVVVLALGTGAFLWMQHVRTSREADRAAVAAVRLVITGTDVMGTGGVPLQIRNDGPAPVSLVSLLIEAPGYGEVTLSNQVLPGALVQAGVPDTTPCRPELMTNPAQAARLTFRTERGTTVTRTISLSGSAITAVNGTARTRCRYLPPDEAFQGNPAKTAWDGAELRLTVNVRNVSALPIRLLRLESPDSLAQATLEGGARVLAADSVGSVVVVLRSTHCYSPGFFGHDLSLRASVADAQSPTRQSFSWTSSPSRVRRPAAC